MTTPPTSTPPSSAFERDRSTQRSLLMLARGLSYLVYAYVVVVEIILTLGFALLLLGANPSSSFVEWIYRSLDRVMKPFRGIFTPVELGSPETSQVDSILDTSVLFAMIIYGMVALGVHALITWLGDRISRVDREREYQRRQQLGETTVYREVTTQRGPADVVQPAPPPDQPPPGRGTM